MESSACAPAAVFFSADGYSTRTKKLMGRQSAGSGFLRAYIQSAPEARIQAVLAQANQAEPARQVFAQAGHTGALEMLETSQLERVRDSGVFYLPMPGLDEWSWRRAQVGERAFSLCGVTHTIASHAVMSALSSLLTLPVRPWDALICTSKAVRDAVSVILAKQAEYLRWRLGASRFEPPQLPVIPLGVHPKDFEFSPEVRAKARARLGVQEKDVVVLFTGRLSFHAKAHPHPMLLAIEQHAAKRAKGSKVHLVQCGWYANEFIQSAFEEAQAQLAPHVVHHHLDGRLEEDRQHAWACADVFTSLSDNIQETFGLTPIEAMAAGLPVVVTDWDGYRDTVRDGVDGFCVPTAMPPAGLGLDLARRYDAGQDTYDLYCGYTCELVAVDVAATAQAFDRLLSDPALRRRMGEAGRARARDVYDWRHIMTQYRALWAHLGEQRRHADDFHGPMQLNQAPDRLDPFELFAGYPTHVLQEDSRVTLLHTVDRQAYERIQRMGVHRFAGQVILGFDEVQPLLQR